MSGLVAARTLADAGREVVVLEASDHLGGRVLSIPCGATVIDAGASHVWSFYRSTRRWLGRLGLSADLVPVAATQRLPIRLGDLPAILRAMGEVGLNWWRLDPARPLRAAPLDNRSIAEYAARRVPPRLVEAALRPAFEWNAFCELEEMSQVLVLQAGRLVLGARPHTLRGGLHRLPLALAQGLDVRRGPAHQVLSLELAGDRVRVRLKSGGELEAGAAVLATLPSQAAAILHATGSLEQFLLSVRHSAVARGWWQFPARDADQGLRLVSSPRGRAALASSRVVGDRRVVSLAIYGPAAAAGEGEDRESWLLARTLDMFPDLLGRPVLEGGAHLWSRAVTTFETGHFRRLAQVVHALPSGRVRLAGDYLVSPTIEGAALSGERAAAELLRSSILEP